MVVNKQIHKNLYLRYLQFKSLSLCFLLDKSATAIPNLDTVLPLIQEFESTKARLGPDCKEDAVLKNIARYKLGDKQNLTDGKVKSKLITRELMGQLYLDKSYLKKFVNRPGTYREKNHCDLLQVFSIM